MPAKITAGEASPRSRATCSSRGRYGPSPTSSSVTGQLAQRGPELQQLLDVLLLRQPAHAHQHRVRPPGCPGWPAAPPGAWGPLPAGSAAGRCPWAPRTPGSGRHTLQQPADLAGGGDHAVRLPPHPAGEGRHRAPPPPDAGGEVVGVVLIYRVIGVDQGDVQLLGDAPGQEKGAELALGVDHIRSPLHQLPHPAARQRRAEPGAGVDTAGIDGAHGRDAVCRPGAEVLRQRQHPDLMAPALQLPLQVFHRGHHSVHRGGVPIGGDQDLHRRLLSRLFSARRPCRHPHIRSIPQPCEPRVGLPVKIQVKSQPARTGGSLVLFF